MTNAKTRVIAVFAAAAMAAAAGPLFAESFEHSARGQRDPFVPLVGAERPAVVELDDAVSPEDVRLEGIATGARGEPVAIINGKVYREGASAGDVSLVKIGKRSITLVIRGKSYEIFLAGDEGGKKGEK